MRAFLVLRLCSIGHFRGLEATLCPASVKFPSCYLRLLSSRTFLMPRPSQSSHVPQSSLTPAKIASPSEPSVRRRGARQVPAERNAGFFSRATNVNANDGVFNAVAGDQYNNSNNNISKVFINATNPAMVRQLILESM
jgi:hypothetical protein